MDANELRARLSAVPPPDTPGFWSDRRREVRAYLLDPKRDPADFRTWPPIHGTMYVGEGAVVAAERQILAREQPEGYAKCLDTNDVHQLYHLHQWLKASGRKLADLNAIVEFGGGFGALCRLVRAMGFTGRYAIIDLPEFLLLQEFYLSGHGVEAEYGSLEELRLKRADLFIAIRSLSECDATVRTAALRAVLSRGYLFNYAGAEADSAFFAFAVQHGKMKWVRTETEHLPSDCYRLGWTPGKRGAA